MLTGLSGAVISTKATTDEEAALLLLLRRGTLSWNEIVKRLRSGVSIAALSAEQGLGVDDLFGEGRTDLDQTREWAEQQRAIEGRDFVTMIDPAYPARLLDMTHPSPVVFMQGRMTAADAQGVAIIGTRKPTVQGDRAARQLAEHLASQGRVVISGLAAGIDRAAHEGALLAGGRTVAVIGTGLDQVYPAENRALQAHIAGAHLVLSQFWPEAAPTKLSFPLRNELMAAYSHSTCVIEAGERSGARIQARAAVKQGRRLLFHNLMKAQEWARELVASGAAHWIDDAPDLN